jgi:hypothetical protein
MADLGKERPVALELSHHYYFRRVDDTITDYVQEKWEHDENF